MTKCMKGLYAGVTSMYSENQNKLYHKHDGWQLGEGEGGGS